MSKQTQHIYVKRVNETMIVTPADNLGELEFEELEAETLAIRNQYEQSDVQHLVVDLHHAEFLGSSTLGWLLDLRKIALSRGGRMFLCGVSATGREVLGVTHLADHWPIYTTREDAMAAIGAPTAVAEKG